VGGYVRQFDVTVEQDGQPITVTLRPAKYADITALKGDDQDAIVRGFQRVLAEYIVDMKGPVDAAGVQVLKEEFLSAAYFLVPVLHIGTEWVRRATPLNPQSPGA
jgi:hypothetical protein